VTTLRGRIARRDAAFFVGREDELAWFERALRGDTDERIVHVVGPGGIGKSTLVREVERRAAELGAESMWIDGREVAPFLSQVEQAMADVAATAPTMIVFDSYELISSLDGFLRDVVIPELDESTLVVFLSRHPPARGWFERGWDSLVHTMRLGPLDAPAVEQLAIAHGVEIDEIHDLVQWSHGSPLAVVVGASRGPGRSVGELADRLLGDERDISHQRVLSVASIARVTTPEMLADVLDDADAAGSFAWLASRSFADPLATGVALHALVADAVRAALRERDPVGEAELRRRIADHLHRRALGGHRGLSTDLQHLVVDPNVRWGFSSDAGSRYHIDQVRPGDADAIGAVLEAVGGGDWWSITEVFFDRHPEYCGVARTAEGEVGGYFVAVSPRGAPPAAEHDPLLGPWLAYARNVLRSARAVIWRDAVDLTGGEGEITSLLGAGGLLSTGVANPRYGFLPITPLLPAAMQFSQSLGATHVAELDIATHGQDLQCHIVDFGARGLLGFQRDWIYRETGSTPPSDEPTVDPIEVIKLLRDPDGLARGPDWLGSNASERRERLRGLVNDALAVFGDHRDDQMARDIVVAAYLEDGATHDTIARRLHLSRSAYFRRLHAASQRVSEELAARLDETR
jgi:hypothetical protein